MNINKELTAKFYQTYSPCDCGDCRYFMAQIERQQPALCAFLRELGIDPQKPYELQSICLPQDRKIDYLDCAYLVVGQMEEGMQTVIEGITVSACPANTLPKADITDEYFYISFGPLSMPFDYTMWVQTNRSKELVAIKQVLDHIDPMGLLAAGCPKDEYAQEAILIAKIIDDDIIDRGIDWKQIQEVFKQQFGQVLPKKICMRIEEEISLQRELAAYFDPLRRCKSTKDKVTLDVGAIVLKVHDNFVVKHTEDYVYINNKLYSFANYSALLNRFCDFVTNADRVYVQYEHKHLCFHPGALFVHFKVFPKRQFALSKVKHLQDVELIFDNRQVIYSAPYLLPNLPEQQIVDDMYRQPIHKPYEKVFYAPDKRKRLVVFRKRNFYSYEVERLTIVDEEERAYFNCYAVWEPDWQQNSGGSLYDSLDRLLTDIAPLISNWEQKE